MVPVLPPPPPAVTPLPNVNGMVQRVAPVNDRERGAQGGLSLPKTVERNLNLHGAPTLTVPDVDPLLVIKLVAQLGLGVCSVNATGVVLLETRVKYKIVLA